MMNCSKSHLWIQLITNKCFELRCQTQKAAIRHKLMEAIVMKFPCFLFNQGI